MTIYRNIFIYFTSIHKIISKDFLLNHPKDLYVNNAKLLEKKLSYSDNNIDKNTKKKYNRIIEFYLGNLRTARKNLRKFLDI